MHFSATGPIFMCTSYFRITWVSCFEDQGNGSPWKSQFREIHRSAEEMHSEHTSHEDSIVMSKYNRLGNLNSANVFWFWARYLYSLWAERTVILYTEDEYKVDCLVLNQTRTWKEDEQPCDQNENPI